MLKQDIFLHSLRDSYSLHLAHSPTESATQILESAGGAWFCLSSFKVEMRIFPPHLPGALAWSSPKSHIEKYLRYRQGFTSVYILRYCLQSVRCACARTVIKSIIIFGVRCPISNFRRTTLYMRQLSENNDPLPITTPPVCHVTFSTTFSLSRAGTHDFGMFHKTND